MHNNLINEIINEVEKHHNMKMSVKCAEALLNILRNHCPHLKSTESCPCDPCECKDEVNCCKDDNCSTECCKENNCCQ